MKHYNFIKGKKKILIRDKVGTKNVDMRII